jgi:hypothetical protein
MTRPRFLNSILYNWLKDTGSSKSVHLLIVPGDASALRSETPVWAKQKSHRRKITDGFEMKFT